MYRRNTYMLHLGLCIIFCSVIQVDLKKSKTPVLKSKQEIPQNTQPIIGKIVYMYMYYMYI